MVMKKVRVGEYSWDDERLSEVNVEEEASATDYAPPRKKPPIHNL